MPFVFFVQMYVFKIICNVQDSGLYLSADFRHPSAQRAFSLEHFGGRVLSPDQWSSVQSAASFGIFFSELFSLFGSTFLTYAFEAYLYDQFLYEWAIKFFCWLLSVTDDESFHSQPFVDKNGVVTTLTPDEVRERRVVESKVTLVFACSCVVGILAFASYLFGSK